MDKVRPLTIETYCAGLGLECLNPSVNVVNLRDSRGALDDVCNFGFYALFLKHIKCGPMQYGMTTYDYEAGTVVCIAPGQVVRCTLSPATAVDCDALLFSPQLLQGTALAAKMARYSFFSYGSNEALHASKEEQATLLDCMRKIQQESRQDDHHSRDIILMNIELLLEYCLRFYDRQFTTRTLVNHDLLSRFEKLLDDYLATGTQREQGLPTVKYFADKVCLSSNYFGDLVKKLTGKTAQEYILWRVVDMGKEMILGTDKAINDIAYDLGFQYPQHFTRFFKNKVGMTPLEFRKASQ